MFKKLREKQQIDEGVRHYMEWITRAEDIDLLEDGDGETGAGYTLVNFRCYPRT